MDLWERMHREADSGGSGAWLPPSVASDRRGGAEWPLYRTDIELAQFRQRSRVVCRTNSYAIGLLGNVVNYIVGDGCKYEVSTKEKLPDSDPDNPGGEEEDRENRWLDDQVAAAQDLLDHFTAINRLNASQHHEAEGPIADTRERETVRRVFRDGECFWRLYRMDDGVTKVRWIEPEQIVGTGTGTYLDGWSFGIKHKVWMERVIRDGRDADIRCEDIETIEVYNVRHQTPEMTSGVPGSVQGQSEQTGLMDEEVPAKDVIHLKGPMTDSTLKRGLPAFSFDTLDGLERAARLQRNLSIGASIRAATAEIWKHTAATQAQISGLASGLREGTRTNPVTGNTENIERVRAGMIRRIPAGQEPVNPPVTTDTPYQMQAVQGDIRQAATSLCAPEYLASGDASNANYASTKEAGTPFVRQAQSLQGYFTGAFCRLAWEALKWAAECGKLDERALRLLTIQVEAPKVVMRDSLQVAQEDQILIQAGIKDRKTAALERGLDWDQVEANNQEYTDAHGPEMSPLGMPGDDGMPGGGPGGQPPPGGHPAQEALESKKKMMEGKDDSGHEHDKAGRFGSGSGGGSAKADGSWIDQIEPVYHIHTKRGKFQSDRPEGGSWTHPERLRVEGITQKLLGKNAQPAFSTAWGTTEFWLTGDDGPPHPTGATVEMDPKSGAVMVGDMESMKKLSPDMRDDEIREVVRKKLGITRAEAKARLSECGGEGGTPGPCPSGTHADLPGGDELHQKADEQAEGIQKKGILNKLGAPGRWLKGKAQGMYEGMAARYGKPAAIAIMASGQVLAWGATAAGAAVGVPVWLPGSSLWGAAPGAAIAEVYLGAKSAWKKLRGQEGLEEAETVELSDEEIEELGKQFAEQLKTAWAEKVPKPVEEGLEEDGPELIDLPDVRQMHNFDCGCACTKAIATYFSVAGNRTEEDFIREMGTTPEDGTRWQNIVKWFEGHGLTAQSQEGMTLEDLRRHWSMGHPVIVPVQDYGTKEEFRENQSGHYVVVIGHGFGHVFIQDPSAANAESGGRLPNNVPDSIQDFGKLMVREGVFESAWHDMDATMKVLVRFGIAVGKGQAATEAKDDTGHEHDKLGRFGKGGAGKSKEPAKSSPTASTEPSPQDLAKQTLSLRSSTMAEQDAKITGAQKKLEALPVLPHEEKHQADVLAAVPEKMGFSRPTIQGVYDSVGKPAGLGIQQFHGVLMRMQNQGKLRLSPYTQALASHPAPEFLLPADREFKFYLERPT